MRIALCLEYPVGQFGGTEMIVQELLRGLPNNFEIVLVSPDSARSLKDSGFAPRVTRHLRWEPEGVSFNTSRQVARDLQACGVELAHFHFGGNYGWGNRIIGQCPVVFLKKLGIPCLSNNNGVFSILDGYCGSQRSWFIKLGYFLPAWISKVHVLMKLTTEIAVSKHDYLALRRYYFPWRSRFQIIYPSRIRERQLRNDVPRTTTILCVGTIGPRKGQTYLMEAFVRVAAKHQAWQLVLIGRHGDVEMAQQIQHQIERHGLSGRVQLLEKCSSSEVDQWMCSAAIFVMPSVAEGLGMSLQEALYNGCACVGSRVGGIPDLIQDNDNGLLVEPANVQELAEALIKLINDDTQRGRLSSRGPKSVLEKNMTAERMVARYAKMYERILATESA